MHLRSGFDSETPSTEAVEAAPEAPSMESPEHWSTETEWGTPRTRSWSTTDSQTLPHNTGALPLGVPLSSPGSQLFTGSHLQPPYPQEAIPSPSAGSSFCAAQSPPPPQRQVESSQPSQSSAYSKPPSYPFSANPNCVAQDQDPTQNSESPPWSPITGPVDTGMRKRKISDITGAEESQLERSNRRLSEPDKMQSDRARLEHYEPGSGGEESGSEKEKGVKRRKRNRRGNRRAKPRDSGSDRDRDGDPGSRDRGPKGPHGNGSRERPMGEEVRVS